jgi:hypothetical protein
MNNEKFKEILVHARQRAIKDWHGYSCINAVQEMNRLCFHYETFEVQVNEIVHSKVPHIHTSCMTSLILDKGYQWVLQQAGAATSLQMFAAPGSVLRMGPTDTHWIPPQKERSLSLCVFEHQSDWHKHYPTLDNSEFHRLWNLFNQKFDELLLRNPNFVVDCHQCGMSEMLPSGADQTQPSPKSYT